MPWAGAEHVSQQQRGALWHLHLEPQPAPGQLQIELEERAALLFGCSQFRDLPGQPGREPERQPAVDRLPAVSLAEQSSPFPDPVSPVMNARATPAPTGTGR